MATFTWSILTGEYPPQAGGVADYTALLARALADAGDEVHVWTAGDARVEEGRVQVHAAPGAFGPRALRALDRGHRRLPREAIVLVQYTPHAFGLRGVNLPFCAWAAGWRARSLWVMFHEVHFPFERSAPLRHQALSLAQQGMARLLASRARRTFVSTPAWTPVLARVAPRAPTPAWLPVPSNLPTVVAPAASAAARDTLGVAPGQPLLGHFGSYGAWFREHVVSALLRLLERPERRAVLLGRGGEVAAAALVAARPALAGRVHARAGSAAELSALIAGCDLLLQPFVDGPTTRRGSLMAALALGRAVVTNDGPLTDDLFRHGLVALAASPAGLVAEAERLLAAPAVRARLESAAAAAYRERFALERTVETLRAAAREEGERCDSR